MALDSVKRELLCVMHLEMLWGSGVDTNHFVVLRLVNIVTFLTGIVTCWKIFSNTNDLKLISELLSPVS